MRLGLFAICFLLMGSIFWGCAPIEIKSNEAHLGAKDSSSVLTVEKYPFAKDYEKAYHYRSQSPNAQIIEFLGNAEKDSLRQNNPVEYLRALSEMIDSSAKESFEKVKMAYDATALLLHYDIERINRQDIFDQSWEDVLISKKAVCEGYASLFKKICDLLNIPCEKVHGYARTGFAPLSSKEDLAPNHAWNIVQIGDFWYNVDCTWGSGYIESQTYTRQYNTEWLFINGDHFRYTHFPLDSNYQLATPKINQDQFKALPRLDPIFFDKFKKISSLKSVNEVDSVFTMTIYEKEKIDAHVSFYELSQNKIIENKIWETQDNDSMTIAFQAPFSGMFLGTIMIRTEENVYRSSAYFFVHAKKPSNVQYPILLRSSAKDFQIESPLVALQPDSTYDFKVKISNKKHVLLYCNGKHNRLNPQGNGFFSKKVKIPHDAKEIILEVSDSEYGEYEGLAKFLIRD